MIRRIFTLVVLLVVAGGSNGAWSQADHAGPNFDDNDYFAYDTAQQVKMAFRYVQAGDYAKAFSHLLIAARRGHSPAQVQIGMFYQEGRGGVTADPVEAMKWYLLARQPASASFTEQVMIRMTPEQISEARARASAWRPERE